MLYSLKVKINYSQILYMFHDFPGWKLRYYDQYLESPSGTNKYQLMKEKFYTHVKSISLLLCNIFIQVICFHLRNTDTIAINCELSSKYIEKALL